MGLVHVVLSINCIFADTVDDDVGMNVTGSIVSVCMSDYQCLIAGKVLSGIFQTHEGSGLSNTESDIKKSAKGAVIEKGIAIHGSSVDQAKDVLERWIQK